MLFWFLFFSLSVFLFLKRRNEVMQMARKSKWYRWLSEGDDLGGRVEWES